MNDFTKEELTELHYCVAHYYNCKFTSPENIELENKHKSMIDNYCEHKLISGHRTKPVVFFDQEKFDNAVKDFENGNCSHYFNSLIAARIFKLNCAICGKIMDFSDIMNES